MKKALTIGELLVTMTIIGTISALVLPGVIKDYHKRLYVTKLKKVIEILDGAINQACSDSNVSYFYQTPYTQYVEGGSNQQAFLDKYFKKVAISSIADIFPEKYRTLSGTEVERPVADNSGYIKLTGGEAISFYCNLIIEPETSRRCVFRVDISSNNGPNIVGRDLFSIFVDPKTNKLYDKYPSTDCGLPDKKLGEGCFNHILENNWEIKN